MPDMMQSDLSSPPMSPPGPSKAEMSSLGWGMEKQSGMGPEASDPQVKALQGVKLIEMGAQVLAASVPELAGPVQAFVQQLAQLVPQVMSQNMAGAPTPVPAAPAPAGPGGMV